MSHVDALSNTLHNDPFPRACIAALYALLDLAAAGGSDARGDGGGEVDVEDREKKTGGENGRGRVDGEEGKDGEGRVTTATTASRSTASEAAMAVLANTLPAMVTGTDGRAWDKKVVALGLKGLQALVAAGCDVDVPVEMCADGEAGVGAVAGTGAGATVGPGVLGAAAGAAKVTQRMQEENKSAVRQLPKEREDNKGKGKGSKAGGGKGGGNKVVPWRAALEKCLSSAAGQTPVRAWPGAGRRRMDWTRIPPGCDPSAGKHSVVRAWRKRRQVENLLGPVEWLVNLRREAREAAGAAGAAGAVGAVGSAVGSTGAAEAAGTADAAGTAESTGAAAIRVIDFCGGSGMVGLPVAAFFNDGGEGRAAAAGGDVEVEIVDTCGPKIDTAQRRIHLSSPVVVRCCAARVGTVEDHEGGFDVGVALHACGTATDAVLDRCLKARAAMVLAPCCVGSLASADAFESRPRSLRFAFSHTDNPGGLSPLEMRSVSRSADCTIRANGSAALSGDNRLRRECKRLVDADRMALCEEAGYVTACFTMQPFGVTPQNGVLVAWPQEWGDLP